MVFLIAIWVQALVAPAPLALDGAERSTAEYQDKMMLAFMPGNQNRASAQPQRPSPAGPAGAVSSGGVRVGNAADAASTAFVVPPPAPLGQAPGTSLAQSLLCTPGMTPEAFAAGFSSGAEAQGLVMPATAAAQLQAQGWTAPGIMTPAPGQTGVWLPARHEVPLWSVHPGAPKLEARQRPAFEYHPKITPLFQGPRCDRDDGMIPEGGVLPPLESQKHAISYR